jgi:protein-S-isoprenylcysteine O-methyltransferase Ste14
MSNFLDGFQISGLIFFLAVFLGRTINLWIRGNVNPITLGVGKTGFRRLVEIFFFVGLVLWMAIVLSRALDIGGGLFPYPLGVRLIDSVGLKLLGVALVTAGFIIFVWALASFGNSWRVGIDEKAPGDLVTRGIFSVSRNPIFLFLDLYFIGTFLMNGTLILLIFAFIFVLGFHYQITQEERFLERNYGQAYRDYRSRTARYLGWKH